MYQERQKNTYLDKAIISHAADTPFVSNLPYVISFFHHQTLTSLCPLPFCEALSASNRWYHGPWFIWPSHINTPNANNSRFG
jgi:hypothetical protein